MRIALVDPNRETQVPVVRTLEAHGHEVASFTSAGDALARIKSDDKIVALITSAKGSPISGAELCWETRLLSGRQRPIYVLLMSSSSDRMAKIEALDCGANDVIDEPPLLDELCAKLRMAERMISLQRELMRSATTDPLSGVYNRGGFFDEATELCREASDGGSLAVILLDVDRLKEINDRYGHDAGDNAIRGVAAVAQVFGAPVGRLGGDEFGILLRGHALRDASAVAAELQRGLAQLKFETREGTIGVTCSLGVSELQQGDTIDDLMKRADLSLYRAKAEGRNRIGTAPANSWMSARPRQGLVRSLARPSRKSRDRRIGLAASDGLLARVCAAIDLLIASGLSQEAAAQAMAQRMIAAGIPLPKNVGDGNWWERILAWRAAFRDGVSTDEALREYRNVVAAIESFAPHERMERVLESELWNRRRLIVRHPSAPVRQLH